MLVSDWLAGNAGVRKLVIFYENQFIMPKILLWTARFCNVYFALVTCTFVYETIVDVKSIYNIIYTVNTAMLF